MKTNLISAWILITGLLFATGCKEDNPSPTPEPSETDYVVLKGDLSSQTLTADKKYLLQGLVFVRTGQTLTIQPGTVIAGEKRSKGTLVVDRGGKLIAKGTAEKPIVFTSNQEVGDRDRGDWGGLVLLGKAKVNLESPSIEGIEGNISYGGTDDNDSSGELQYVRCEFAGIELTPNNETNGITLAGVGRGTTFEHIQVTYGGDDGIEWFGGSVNGKYLVVFGTWDDCFDIDNGFSGNLQFGLSIRYPSYADQSDSNGFEWDTDGQNNLDRAKTTATLSNFTILGPSIDGNSFSGNYKFGVDLRRNVAASLYNSVVVGFPTAIRMNQSSVFPNYTAGDGELANNIFYGKTTAIVSGSSVTPEAIDDYLSNLDNIVQAGNDFQLTSAYQALGLKSEWFFGKKLNTQYPAHPDFTLTAGTLATGAKFDYTRFNEASRTDQFDKTVLYRGAFGASDWTKGWTHFDPINLEY
jgi:hypothetical protein